MSTTTLHQTAGDSPQHLSTAIPHLSHVAETHATGTPSRSQNHRRRPSYLLLTAGLAVGAATVAWEPWSLLESGAHQAAHADHPAGTSSMARQVTITQPSKSAAAEIVLPATVRPYQSAVLYARVSGYLASWTRNIGDRVTAGDVLAVIETPELDEELAASRALMLEAAAAVTQAKAERVEAEADLKVAQSQVTRIEAQIKLTGIQVQRRFKLLPSGAVPREEYDQYLTQQQTQEAELLAAKADVERSEINLQTRASIIEAREATVKSRQANVERLEKMQSFQRILAPFDGVITARTAEVGMLVNSGQAALFTLTDLSRVRIQLQVPQAYSPRTQAGVEASIRLPESLLAPVRAQITRTTDAVDATNRTMLAEIELANPDNRFQPGSYVQVTLTPRETESTWTIPTNTLAMRVNGAHVATVNARDEIQLKPVRLGRDLGNRIMVMEGIDGDERLVVNPGDDLIDGIPIEVAPPATSHVATR